MKTKLLAGSLLLSLFSSLLAQDTDSLTRIYSKFDFIPGEKVIFFDDFSTDNIGDFPALWNTNNSGEVVTFPKYPGKWLKITNSRSIVTLLTPLTLPENYTIEFDVVPQIYPPSSTNTNYHFLLISTPKPKDLLYGLALPGGTGIRFSFEYNTYYRAYYADKSPELKGNSMDASIRQKENEKYHVAIWVQKQRIRLYLNETKVFDLARAISDKFTYNMIRFENGTPLIGNVRIATGFPDLRNKLVTEGKLVSYGIYFDVNSDRLKPQSAGTLKEIAAILADNPDMRIKIIGHTDADGDDAMNLDLSKRRAAAVKNALADAYNIEASRLETDGKGEKEPVAPNDNGTNKALNRRVEFVKL